MNKQYGTGGGWRINPLMMLFTGVGMCPWHLQVAKKWEERKQIDI